MRDRNEEKEILLSMISERKEIEEEDGQERKNKKKDNVHLSC